MFDVVYMNNISALKVEDAKNLVDPAVFWLNLAAFLYSVFLGFLWWDGMGKSSAFCKQGLF